MPLRLVLLVLDGFSLRHCTPEIAPNLIGISKTWRVCAKRRPFCASVIDISEPCIAGDGYEPIQHGIYANNTFTDTGVRPARDVGARGVTFLDAARARWPEHRRRGR